jgi:hypothetical protein
MNRDLTGFEDSIRFTYGAYVCPPYHQVANNEVYASWSAGGDVFTGKMNIDGSGWTATQRTFTPGESHRCELQVTGDKIYYAYMEEVAGVWQVFTASANRDGTGWTTTQRTNYSSKYQSKLVEGHVRLRIAGDKYYIAWSYPDEDGYWQIWTAEMNTDGTGWTQIQRTTGSPSKWRPELQMIGGKIYYTWWQGSSDWTAQAIWTGELGSNILSKGSAYGLGMDENGRVSGFLDNDYTYVRYLTISGTSKGAQVFEVVDTAEWTHVAMTYDRSFLKLYVDGELRGTRALGDSIQVNPFDLMIGEDFQGILDEVMISNRALTDSEVVEHYHEGIAGLSFVPDFLLDKCDQEDTLWIHVDERVQDLEAAFLIITYDGNFINPTDVIKGPALDPPGNFFLYPDIHPDSILISLAVLSGSFDGPGSILGLIFTTDNEVASTQLSIDSSSLRNSDNQGIVHYTTRVNVQIDCTTPTVEVTSPASGGTYTSLPTLTIDFHDDVGLNRGYYQIESCTGAWTELWSYDSDTSDTTIDWTVSSISGGAHTIYFKVIDDAGNPNSDTCTYSWSFIYQIPSVSLLPSFQLDKCTDVDTLWIYADSNVIGMEGALLKIAYDDSFITPTNVIKGPALDPPDNFSLFPYIYADSIVINLVVLAGYFDGPGSIIGIVLTADYEVDSTHLFFERSTLRDTSNHDIPHQTAGADIRIDCTFPTAVVTSPASGDTLNYLPNLSIHFQDDVGLDQGYYQIDSCTGPWMQLWPHNCTVNDTAISWTVPGVPDGPHTIYFKVTDDAGNANGDTCTYSWIFTYDVTGPTVQVISPPSGGAYNSLPTLTIDLDDNVELDRGYYQIDDCEGTWTELWSYSSNSSDTTISWTVPSVSQGLHTIFFKVTDDAGNANGDTCSYSWSFTYDLTLPTVLVISPPSGGIYNYLPTLTIDLDDDVGLNRGYYQIDGCTGTWAQLWAYNSGSSDTSIDWTVPSVPEGSHDIYFKAIDDAGNSNSDTCSYFWNFTYDTTPPPPPTLISPPDSTVTSDNTPTFIWSSTAGSGGSYTLQYATDSLFTDAVTVSGLGDTTHEVLTPLPDDGYYWHVKAMDRTSNESGYQSRPFMFTIDTGMPAVPFLVTPTDSSFTCDFTPTFTWTSSSLILAGGGGAGGGSGEFGSGSTPVTYTLQYGPDPSFTQVTTVEEIAESTYTIPDTAALTDTTYYWRVEAVDLANNHSGYQAHPFQFEVFIAGDANADGVINVTDVVYLINYKFLVPPGPSPIPWEAGDVDGNGVIDVTDVVYLINFLFLVPPGPPPVCKW